MGRLFREFAVTLAVAITISAVVSLTVTPMMAARLLVATHERRENWLALRQSERVFRALVRGYDRSLRAVLSHAWLMLGVVLGAVALTVMLCDQSPRPSSRSRTTACSSGSARHRRT